MLNDQTFWANDNKVQTAIGDAKTSFSQNVPYRLFPSSVSRNENIIVFSNHFIETFRLMLSDSSGAAILQMSEAERNVWYSYLEYQDGTDPAEPEMLAVITELDNCVVNEVECRTEDYLEQALSTTTTWDTQALTPQGVTTTITLTQEAYDAKVLAGEVIITTTYIITLDSVPVRIYIGSVIIWTV